MLPTAAELSNTIVPSPPAPLTPSQRIRQQQLTRRAVGKYGMSAERATTGKHLESWPRGPLVLPELAAWSDAVLLSAGPPGRKLTCLRFLFFFRVAFYVHFPWAEMLWEWWRESHMGWSPRCPGPEADPENLALTLSAAFVLKDLHMRKSFHQGRLPKEGLQPWPLFPATGLWGHWPCTEKLRTFEPSGVLGKKLGSMYRSSQGKKQLIKTRRKIEAGREGKEINTGDKEGSNWLQIRERIYLYLNISDVSQAKYISFVQ